MSALVAAPINYYLLKSLKYNKTKENCGPPLYPVAVNVLNLVPMIRITTQCTRTLMR